MNKFYLYGASGHCKVIIDIIKQNNGIVHKVFDDNKAIKTILNIAVFGSDEMDEVHENLIISIGNNNIRKAISKTLKQHGFCRVVHPKAIIDSTVDMGTGTVVMAGAIINSSTKIGNHCIINTASVIDHDCKIEDFVHISPNASLAGNVIVGEGTQIGLGANVIPGVIIGKWCIIGAGSTVIEDVPDFSIVVGSPAKFIKLNALKC